MILQKVVEEEIIIYTTKEETVSFALPVKPITYPRKGRNFAPELY
jgi:hypothetical protein